MSLNRRILFCWDVGSFSSGPCLSFACDSLRGQGLPREALGAVARGKAAVSHACWYGPGHRQWSKDEDPRSGGSESGLARFHRWWGASCDTSEIAEGHGGNGWWLGKGFAIAVCNKRNVTLFYSCRLMRPETYWLCKTIGLWLEHFLSYLGYDLHFSFNGFCIYFGNAEWNLFSMGSFRWH